MLAIRASQQNFGRMTDDPEVTVERFSPNNEQVPSFRIADIHVSLCQEETHDASGALGERALRGSGSFTAHECLSAGGPCIPAGPDIHLLSQARRAVTDD
jgi:hypothetical protein